MFKCVLEHYVPFTGVALKLFSDFMEGTDGVGLAGTISEKGCVDVRSTPSVM